MSNNKIKIAKYGWSPDLPDVRDHKYTLVEGGTPLPASVDLRPQDAVPIYDQGQLGSCTGNGISATYAFDLKKQGEKVFVPSRLFIYYNERVIEGTVKTDSGAQIRDGIKTIAQSGVCDEAVWPYADDAKTFKKKPTAACYTAAKKNLAVTYQRVDNTKLVNLQTALASGLPIVFGFTVYASFESDAVAKTGIVPMPGAKEQVLGGHCVVAFGYKLINGVLYFICRNSWGTSWGDKGYFYIPATYLTNGNLADDFWIVQTIK